MKLSEAMRKGATFAPQIIGGNKGYATGLFNSPIESTCAFGAAAHGMLGFEASREEVAQLAGELHRRWEYEAYERMCAAGREGILVSISSDQGMPREAIADLLDEVGL